MAEKLGYIRFGSFARPSSVPLIEQFCETHQVSKGALAEILTVGLSQQSPEFVQAVVAAGKAHVFENNRDGRKRRGKLLQSLKNMSLEELEKAVEQATGESDGSNT